jgi:geranylgeranyl reductase family protein
MKKVAVLGGGPAGSFAAERLAKAGIATLLFDEKLAWEKPCGGGLTYKAYSEYPFLIENDTPKKVVAETYLAAPKAGAVRLSLTRPLVIYSRTELNRMLLDRAAKAGAQVEKTRVLGIERKSDRWLLRTGNGSLEADYCVIATGARNPLRGVGTEWTRSDTMHSLGYFVPADQIHIDIQFLENLEGYIWVFPRCGHLSVGICGKGEPAQALRVRLEQYMDERAIPYRGQTFFAHMLPSLEAPAWRRNRVAGEGWLAVGDAAGLVDPITGEGLYYAIRSADLASRAIIEEKTQSYSNLLRDDFAADLEFAASIAKRMFLGRFLFGSIPARMIGFVRRSACYRNVVQDLFAGTQPYLGLKKRLVNSIAGTMSDVAMSLAYGTATVRSGPPYARVSHESTEI